MSATKTKKARTTATRPDSELILDTLIEWGNALSLIRDARTATARLVTAAAAFAQGAADKPVTSTGGITRGELLDEAQQAGEVLDELLVELSGCFPRIAEKGK